MKKKMTPEQKKEAVGEILKNINTLLHYERMSVRSVEGLIPDTSGEYGKDFTSLVDKTHIQLIRQIIELADTPPSR